MSYSDLKQYIRKYFLDAYVLVFFYILFFDHKHIDIVRAPFFIFLLWCIFKKHLHWRFLFDIITTSIWAFAVFAFSSNLVNGIDQKEIVRILNWLYPYLLAKYILMYSDFSKERMLSYFLSFASCFSLAGIFGFLFQWDTLLGIALFEGNRFVFTFSGINRAGFYLATAIIFNLYFFFKDRFVLQKGNLIYAVSLIIIACGLVLTHERKSLLMVGAVLLIFLFVCKRYWYIAAIFIASACIVSLAPIPDRYQPREMFLNDGMQGRYNAWEAAIGLFKEKPLLGHGYPSFENAYSNYYKKNEETFKFKVFNRYGIAHNLNLNVMAETGILGLIAMNVIFFSIWEFTAFRKKDKFVFVVGTAIVFIYITMQFGNFVHAPIRTDLAFFIFGLFMGSRQRTYKGKEQQ
ncbi:MAG: O-antigen ligase family protein [Desulfobacteraceae bacterium]|nr:O-antigen ligase family protein [Desulfobacteraceae bacterium]